MTVYADVLFLINFLINTCIMLFVQKINFINPKYGRTLISGAFGAVYAVIVFVNGLSGTKGWLIKFLVACTMVFIALGKENILLYIKCTVAMYIVSFVLSGAMLAGMYIKGEGLKLKYILSALLITALIVLYLSRIKARHSGRCIEKITVSIGGIDVNINALVDTGNMLSEPISGKPVLIAEASQFEDAVNQAVKNGYNLKLRYIPYKSLGRESDMLTGFLPDMVRIGKKSTECCVALYGGKLSAENEYTALVSPQIINNSVKE